MDKIASPQELTSELQQLLAYAESPAPSREKLAHALLGLSDRVAKDLPGERERGKAVKDLIDAMSVQYPDVSKKEIEKLVESAVSSVGYKIKDILKKQRTASSEHTATQTGYGIFYRMIDQKELVKLYNRLEKEDEQSAQLLIDAASEIQKALNISSGAEDALSRIMDIVNRGQHWDIALLRNNIFKAANSLGMKLPSYSF